MANELIKAETFTDVSPGKTMTSARANNMQEGLKAAVGMIANKTEMTANQIAVGDMVLVQDVSDGSAAEPKKCQTQYLLPETVRQLTQLYAAGTLSGGVYAVTLSPAATAYTAGMVVCFKADSANAGAVDINVNGLGAKNLFTRAGGELAANDILVNQVVVVVYDGTQFQVVQVISAAEVTATHLIEAARHTVHQYAAGTLGAGAYAVTLSPAATAYTAGMVVRFKADSANAGAVDINVNGLGAKNLFKRNASSELAANDILANQIVTVVYDGTQFQLADAKSPDYASAATALPGSAAVATFAHGLGAKPTRVRVTLMNNTAAAAAGYNQNDELDIASVIEAGTAVNAFAVSADATNVYVSQLDTANVRVIPRTGGAYADITEANWAIKVYAST